MGGSQSGGNGGASAAAAAAPGAGGASGDGGTGAETEAGASGIAGSADLEGGATSATQCDDRDACTEDVSTDGTCSHIPVTCADPGPCLNSRCNPSTGACENVLEPNGTSCDDRRVCTSGDACVDGVCKAELTSFLGRQIVERNIPEGKAACDGVAEWLSSSFEVTAPGQFGTATIVLDWAHAYISQIQIMLRHEPSGRVATVLNRPAPLGIEVDGTYTFEDGAPAYPMDIEYEPLPLRSIAPVESFAATFSGLELTGTWTVLVGDYCASHVGVLRSVELRLKAQSCP